MITLGLVPEREWVETCEYHGCGMYVLGMGHSGARWVSNV